MNLYALFFGLALFGFCSCDNDDSVTPDPQARQAFESKYPNATQVEWEKKNNYLMQNSSTINSTGKPGSMLQANGI